MMAAYDLSLVIPCFNEAEGVAQLRERLAAVLPRLRANGSTQLVLVDDGSTDATFALLESAFAGWDDVLLVQHEQNRGLGEALRTGFAHAQGALIVTTDSDSTYPFDEIPALLTLLRPGVDVVTASPYHPGGGLENVPRYRIVLSKGASTLYRLLVDGRIHTYTAMFRVYRREVVEQVPTVSTGYLMVAELLVKAMLAGYQVAEYPAVLRVRRYGTSKAKIIRILRSHLQFMASLLLTRLSRRPLRLRHERAH
jgi:dolichol-phosphate mannosyltransferase